MIISIIATVFLIFGTVTMFVTGSAEVIPLWAKFIPILGAAALWGCRFLRQAKGRTGIAGIILLIFFYATIIYTIPSVLWLWTAQAGDPEKDIPAMTLGDPSGKKLLYIIYHPGASSFNTNIIAGLAEAMGKDGFKTVLFSANKNLKIDLKNASAVGFSSPIYFGNIRPPVENYLKRTDPKGIKTFIILTCGSPEAGNKKDYLDNFKSKLIKEGAVIIGGKVFSKSDTPDKIKTGIKSLAEEVEGGLR